MPAHRVHRRPDPLLPRHRSPVRRRAALRIKAAGFEALKTVTDFDVTAQPSLDGGLVACLEAGASLAQAGIVVLLGPGHRQDPCGHRAGTASALIGRIAHHAEISTTKDTSDRIRHTSIETLPSVTETGPADQNNPARCSLLARTKSSHFERNRQTETLAPTSWR